MAKCLICGQNKKLCDAHIYPRWCFRQVAPKGDNRGFRVISTDIRKSKKRLKGSYDKNLFCVDCDRDILGIYDDYGKKVLVDTSLKLVRKGNSGVAWEFDNIDIDKLKRFFIIVFWRSCLSNLDEFKEVTIPQQYLDDLKAAIFNPTILDIEKFAIMVTKYKGGKKHEVLANSVIGIPYRLRLKNINYWVFCYPGGFKVFIKVDKRKTHYSVEKFVHGQNNKAYILEYENFEDSREFKQYKEIAKYL